jgi:DNA-binding PadR family transcriptional regulator
VTLKKKKPAKPGSDLLQGTLDMLVLQTLRLGAAHGYTIARLIEQRSDAFLQVEQGSLYPALNRLGIADGSIPTGRRPRTTGARATTG